MSNESERVKKELIPKAIEALRNLDIKETPDVPAQQAIRAMRRQIERVLRLGYSYDEISVVLKKAGINISGSRIKVLLADIKKPVISKYNRKTQN